MSKEELTKEQTKHLHDTIVPMLGFLYRLRTRMAKTRFRGDDPLYLNTTSGTLQRLLTKPRLATACGGGTGCPLKVQKTRPGVPVENIF